MKRNTRKCTSTLIAVVSASALLLTGCSSDNPEVDETPATVEVQPPAALADSGKITYCATLDNPPRAYVDESSQEVGFEVDLGNEIASLMGLDPTWLQLPFDSLISTLQADQCQAIVQELFIKPERLEVIDMVPFSNSGQQIVVRKDSGLTGTTLKDYSGVKFAVPNGTTIHNLAIEANKELEAEGKKPIDLIVLQTTTDTFQQLNSGVVEALGTTTTAAAYYTGQNPDEFKMIGPAFGLIQTGIGIKKGNDDLTDAVQEAFDLLKSNGKYDELIEKWSMQGSEL
jgi:polar amino acid transport system substrate-binding protein